MQKERFCKIDSVIINNIKKLTKGLLVLYHSILINIIRYSFSYASTSSYSSLETSLLTRRGRAGAPRAPRSTPHPV